MQVRLGIFRSWPDAAFQLWQINCSGSRSEERRFALVAGPFRQLIEDIHHSHAVEDVTARLERFRDLRRRAEIEKRGKGQPHVSTFIGN